MKSKFVYTGVLNVLLSFYAIQCFSQDTAKVSSYFIGSHGYLIESSEKKVAIDALIYWTGNAYGYILPPKAVVNKMELSAEPFDSIDVILISHAHSEHYNSQIIEKVMLKNNKTEMILPQEVYNIFITQVDSLDKYSERIHVPVIGFYNSLDTIVNDIPITITNLEHGSDKKMNLFTYVFELDGIRFLHLNQWNYITTAMQDTLGFNDKRADVAFIGSDYITNSTHFQQFKKINPRFSELSHIDGATSTKLNTINNKINEYKQQYPMDLMEVPMEQLLFKKTSDTILVDTLNNAPNLSFNLKDTSIYTNNLYEYTIPQNLFNDRDGDTLSLDVTLDNGSELPAWLSFSDQNRTLSGTASASAVLNIKITSADFDGAERNDVFKLTVADETPHDELPDFNLLNVKIFPNPTSGQFTIFFGNTSSLQTNVEIYDLNGKRVFYETYNNTASASIGLKNIHQGIYLLKIINENKVVNKKIVIY